MININARTEFFFINIKLHLTLLRCYEQASKQKKNGTTDVTSVTKF